MAFADFATKVPARTKTPRHLAVVPTEASGSLVPSLVEASEEYADLTRKFEDLGRDYQAAVEDERRIAGELARASQPKDQTGAMLADILNGKLPRSRRNADELRAEHVAARERIEDLDRAKRLLSQYMVERRSEVSVEICRSLEQQYKARVRAVATALLQAHEAQIALDSLASELTARDVAWVGALEPMAPVMLGHPQDNGGPLAHWLRRAENAGYIAADEVPVELR
jgi:hypothetical protein